MEEFSKSEIIIKIGPAGNPYDKIMRTERRLGIY